VKCVESMGQLIKTAKVRDWPLHYQVSKWKKFMYIAFIITSQMGSTREDAHMDANRVTILTGTIVSVIDPSEYLSVESCRHIHLVYFYLPVGVLA